MLQQIIEQKVALAAYATEYSIVQLTSHQLELATKVVSALSPIEEVTKSISADAASISVVLPFVRIPSKTFGEYHDDHGVCTMKREMNALLERRFSDAEGNENLLIATILDPRFKEKFLTGITIVEKVKSLVHENRSHN